MELGCFFLGIAKGLIQTECRRVEEVIFSVYVDRFPLDCQIRMVCIEMNLFEDVPVITQCGVAKKGWVTWSCLEVFDVLGVTAENVYWG